MAEKRVEDSIFARRPIATAIALGVISLAPHFFLSPEMSLSFAAVLIGVIAGVYFGFAVVRGFNWEQLIELNVASSFGVAALLENGVSPWFLPVAYLAHGLISPIITACGSGSYPFRNGISLGALSSIGSLDWV
jgi:hypothetical protein